MAAQRVIRAGTRNAVRERYMSEEIGLSNYQKINSLAEKPAQTVTGHSVISPTEFLEEMRSLSYEYDTEHEHLLADELMCKILESLGYAEGVKVFREMTKWYA